MMFCLLLGQLTYFVDGDVKTTKLCFILLIAMTLIIFLFPMKIFASPFRLSLVKTVGNIVIAPFGQVEFRHFFLADIFCSAKQMFFDTATIMCLAQEGEECLDYDTYIYVLGVLPFWWRFWQCIHRYYEDRTNTTQLWNAAKYYTGIASALLLINYSKKGGRFNDDGCFTSQYCLWIIMQMINSIYSYSWDLYMDWGLLRSKEAGTYGLRHKISYHKAFYYWAIVSNLLLRGTWLITLSLSEESYFFSWSWVSIAGMLELLRRWQWALIRIENEQLNNYEKYRMLLTIPDINDYHEDNNNEEVSYKRMIDNVFDKIQN